MLKNCKQCSREFEITEDDLEFYKKVSAHFDDKSFEMPAPGLCPTCRSIKRLAFRNEVSLYYRKCDFSGKNIITMYSPDKPYKVYDQHVWWGDDWDPLEYGRDVDLNRSFFEQYKELQMEVPRISLSNIDPENSDHCNLALRNKNCYLVFTADYNENCGYGRFFDKNFDCYDCDYTYESNCCYYCLDVEKGHRCLFSSKIINSSELTLCYNMIGCHDCIACANLRNKQYYIFNEKFTKEEYEKKKAEFAMHTYASFEKLRDDFEEFLEKQPRKFLELVNCDNSIGDHLRDCKNAQNCYNSVGLEDCKYMMNCYYSKDCYDWNFVGMRGSELCHEMASSAYSMLNCHFCANCWENCSNFYYCELCLRSKDLFGCIGLRNKQYCILNKQYSKEEYEVLVPKIIEKMIEDGEWGEFFPKNISTFAYNETVACEYFPLNKDEALKAGWNWIDDNSEDNYSGPKVEIAADVNDIDEDICKKILICEETAKPYKVIPQELKFCKKMGIPLPRISPKARFKDRMTWRNGWELFDIECDKCAKAVKSTYEPGSLEPVYCEECYKKEIY